MTETRTIPTLSRHALALAKGAFDRTVNDIGLETLEAMGLSAEDGWVVDFNAGVCRRQVENAAADSETAGSRTPAGG